MLPTISSSGLFVFMFDLCLILTFGVLHHWYQGIYEGLYKIADMVLKAIHILYNKIYGLLCWMYGQLLQIFQSGASDAISSKEGDIEMQLAVIQDLGA